MPKLTPEWKTLRDQLIKDLYDITDELDLSKDLGVDAAYATNSALEELQIIINVYTGDIA